MSRLDRASRLSAGAGLGHGSPPSPEGDDRVPRGGHPMRHPIRFLTAAAACVALLATLTGVAIAQGVLGEKFRSGDTVTVAAGETVPNDLYAFAGTVRVDGTVD